MTVEEAAPYRWTADGELKAITQKIQRDWSYSESSGRSNPPPSYLTELTCDHVESDKPAELHLNVPAGAVRVYALCGAAGGERAQVWDIALSAGASQASATFAGPYETRALELATKATDAGLTVRIQTRSRWVLNALIVAPESSWKQVRADLIDPIEHETFLLPDDVLEKWKLTPRGPAVVDQPRWSTEEITRGFILFHRHYLEPVWPTTVPAPDEGTPTMRAFASRDEYEPMTLTLRALKDLNRVDLEVSELRNATGDVLPASSVDLRSVRIMMVRPNYRTYETYYPAPDVLMPWTPRPVKKDENLRFWLTVYAGPATPAGVYRGAATVTADNAPPVRVPIAFRVADIKLQKDRSLVYGHYYHHPYGQMDRAPDAFSRDWWRRKADLEHADMAAHGNNTVVLGIGGRQQNGVWQLDFDGLGRAIDLYRKHGFYQPVICHIPVSSIYWKYMKNSMGSHLRLIKIPPDDFFTEVTELVRIIENERGRRQWPELLYYPIDEPSRSPTSVEFMTRIMEAIKKVPDVRTYVTADPAHPEFEPMKPFVDVWCCQPFSLDRDTVVKDMAARGVEYWCYPNHIAGENDHTPCTGARMTYGFGFWRSGFRALTPWIYQAVVGDQWNYLDGGAMDFFNRTDDDAAPIPVALWEAYREGIDDGRYITTLTRTIERAREAGLDELADRAQQDLDLVWNAIDVQPKYKEDGLWNGETFDVYRWMIASQILRLQAALPGK
jgi:hypothetical protein